MKTSTTFSIHFWIKKTFRTKDNYVPIYVRITVDGKRADLSIKRCILEHYWCSHARKVLKGDPEANKLNDYLDFVYKKLIDCHKQLSCENNLITAQSIKIRFLGLDKKVQTIQELMSYHSENEIKKLEKGTAKNYGATEKYLNKYLNECIKQSDVSLKRVDYSFVVGFENFLMGCQPLNKSRPLGNNGIMKHMERLQKLTTIAFKHGWIKTNPFALYQLKFQDYDAPFLEEMELEAISNLVLVNDGLIRVRDIFIFACYTGLSYIDVKNLKKGNICYGVDGEKWVMIKRQKSSCPVKQPLLDEACSILEEYANFPSEENNYLLLPVISSQKMNKGLKALAELCQIKKNLTFHVARHTFATTITLLNDVPIETVSKVLGHKKLSTTQKYARVVEKKISNDFKQLKTKLKTDKKVINDKKGKVFGYLQIV
ncbi:site-specific integrase [Mariniflexile sp. HNIBRBA6329]|uniref:site-specific integrase n=1 Tax=Mariniflexile sp. HNIBRBA6329 TaxID=3373088 RepID=UPI003746F375